MRRLEICLVYLKNYSGKFLNGLSLDSHALLLYKAQLLPSLYS